jgi:outer membrane receptor for ferrienterochelin and colicins
VEYSGRARVDKNSQIDNPVLSPRFSLRYNPNEVLSFRAGYSSGFRAPQIYDEDLHGSAIGGETSFVQNADNLKTERSHSISCSADFSKKLGNMSVEILAEVFYTKLNNVFYLQDIGKDAAGNLILERRNGSGASVAGVNFEGKFVPLSSLQFQMGFTTQRSRYTKAETWSDDTVIETSKKDVPVSGQLRLFDGLLSAF